MKTVNRHWLDGIWCEVSEGHETPELMNKNYSREDSIQFLAEKYIGPGILEGRHPLSTYVTRIKDTWRYAIHALSDKDLQHSFDSMLPVIKSPKDIRWFYIKLWEYVFPNEPWEIEDISEYHDLNDQFARIS